MNIDIEKYKTAWKKELAFEEKTLSALEVSKFMRSSSKNLMSMFKKALVFDIILKGILFILVVVLIVLASSQTTLVYVNLFIQAVILFLIGWQINTLRKLPINKPEPLSAIQQLQSYIAFYHNHYIYSIFNSAASSVLLFLIGSIYYLHYKYGLIPSMDIIDFLVLGMFVILGFGFSYNVQLKQSEFHIKQLKSQLKEIEENALTEKSVQTYRRDRLRNILLVSLLFIVGLLLLIFLITRIQG